MKRLILLICLFLLYSCGDIPYDPPPPSKAPRVEQKQDKKKSGLGMTFRGKPGIEIAPGLVLPFDGSGIEPGF